MKKVLSITIGLLLATLAAARRWADVTSTDYVPALLERAAVVGRTFWESVVDKLRPLDPIRLVVHPGLQPLQLHSIGKIGSHVLRYDLGA